MLCKPEEEAIIKMATFYHHVIYIKCIEVLKLYTNSKYVLYTNSLM